MAWLNAARAHLATRPQELLPEARIAGRRRRLVPHRRARRRPGGRIARYAWGGDYHAAMKSAAAARRVALWLRGPTARSRVFVDNGPLVERDAAIRAGLGFRGKNTNLLTPIGSFVFLGALLTDVELDFDQPVAQDCGSCRLCIDACPTDALDEAYHLAAERCIAYLTIEHRGPDRPGAAPEAGRLGLRLRHLPGGVPVQRLDARSPARLGRVRAARRARGSTCASSLTLDEDAFRERFAARQ